MNKQTENGITYLHVFGPGTGMTWNTMGGCFHRCEWNINGSRVECYANAFAERMSTDKFYPDGFRHYYWHPDRLEEPLRRSRPAGIFLNSMFDIMGEWVDSSHIMQVLDICRRSPQHIFFLLTKNPNRLAEFVDVMPKNVWIGVSTPPTYMKGAYLDNGARFRYLREAAIALWPYARDGYVTWMSAEPLSFDVGDLGHQAGLFASLRWIVMGPGTRGKMVFPPNPDHIYRLESEAFLSDIPVFYKPTMRNCPGAIDMREEYPTWAIPVQE